MENFLYVIDFLHISHVEKLLYMTICHMEKFLHMTEVFSTSTACGVCDKYQVWWGGHIWPFHDALRPHRVLTVRDRQQKNWTLSQKEVAGGG